MASFIPWVIFYFFGGFSEGFSFPGDVHVNDWHKELEYLRIVQLSLLQGEFPFHVKYFDYLYGSAGSTAFLAAPIYTLSIQSFFLIFLEPMTFHILNHLLLFLLGFYGCYLIKKEYGLGLVSFLFLVVTFNFYGGFVTKIAAYGPSHLGYYLFPFLIFILLKVSNKDHQIEKKEKASLSVFLAIALSAIIYQGSLHYFIQWVTLLIFWGIFNFKHIRFLLLSAVVTILLSASRLLPAAINFGVQPGPRDPIGYSFNPEFFLQTFISIRDIVDSPAFAWWEFSNYISIFGFLMIFYFAFYNYFVGKEGLLNIKTLVLPLAILFTISFNKIRVILIPQFVPLLNLESLTTRYMVIVCLFLIVIATINFDSFFKSLESFKSKLFIYFLMACHVAFLYLNVYVWSLQRIQKQLYSELPLDIFLNPESVIRELQSSLGLKAIVLSIENDWTNLTYIYSFYIGLSVTLVTTVCIVIFLFSRRQKIN